MKYVFLIYKRFFIDLVNGMGMVVIDKNGKIYFDFISGIVVCNFGYCLVNVVEVV